MVRDRTARFMAAYFLARVAGVLPIEVHATPLIEALEDNWISYDALMGMVALDLIGPRAAGPVRRALATSGDAQQRACLEMLLAHWEAPPGSDGRERAIEALRQVRVTWKVRRSSRRVGLRSADLLISADRNVALDAHEPFEGFEEFVRSAASSASGSNCPEIAAPPSDFER